MARFTEQFMTEGQFDYKKFDAYREQLLEQSAELERLEEEPDNEQFTQEVKTAQDKSEGKGKKADVAKPSVQAVKNEGLEIEVYDADAINGVTVETIEESEQLDELKKSTLASYIGKAQKDARKLAHKGGESATRGEYQDSQGETKKAKEYLMKDKKYADKAYKRGQGIELAAKKLATEEIETIEEDEQLDELKKSTLASYIGKAQTDARHLSRASGENASRSHIWRHEGPMSGNRAAEYHARHKKYSDKSNKRGQGIELAAKKLAKEEVEHIDEGEKWIAGAIKKPGALHKALGVPEDKKIPAGKLEKAAEAPGKMGKRARLAMTLKQLRKEHAETIHEDEQIEEEVTRKHFQQVADLIKSHPDAAKRAELAKHHAEIFKTQNPRFNHQRFYAAANAQVKEDVDQIDELSRGTLTSYIKNAAFDLDKHAGHEVHNLYQKKIGTGSPEYEHSRRKASNRRVGIWKAAGRLADQYEEQIEEAVDHKKFMATYKRNEGDNRHMENVLHLAKHYGTEDDVELAQSHLKAAEKAGHNIHHKENYALHSKLWNKMKTAHQMKEDVEQIEEAQKYDIYHKGEYHRSTTQSKTAKEAKEKYLKAYPKHASDDVKVEKDKHYRESVEHIEERAESPTVGTRKIKSYGTHEHTAEVRYSPEYREYQVHHYKHGKHQGEGPVSYHGEDKDDAHSTARYSAGVKEDVDQIAERELTPAETKKKEELVMSMKKNMPSFKERYGKRAKEVLYAVATKQAKKD